MTSSGNVTDQPRARRGRDELFWQHEHDDGRNGVADGEWRSLCELHCTEFGALTS